MNNGSLSSLLTVKDLKTIKVKFSNSSTLYTYKTIDKSIVQDEFVIVSFNDATIKIARVVEVDNVPDLRKDVDYKWIVQKVNFSTYNELNELEKQTFAKLQKLESEALINNSAAVLADRLNVDIETLQKAVNINE